MSEAEGDECHAASGAHLRELLRGNHRYVFTLIHKFQTPEMLCDRPDVIVLTDEAHRSHTLMQTIARANRVFPGKHSGMIVDYANVFASLEKALAIYGAGKDGKNPVKDKAKLVADLRRAVDTATTFCATRQVILPAIEQLPIGSLERLQRIDDAVNALISPDPLRRDFFGHERLCSYCWRKRWRRWRPTKRRLNFIGGDWNVEWSGIKTKSDGNGRTKMNPQNEFNDRLIRLSELERIFGVCKRTVRRKAEAGELPPLRRIGRAVGMLESQVKAYFQRLSQPS